MVGREETVLVEKPGFGRTPCFAPVLFEGEFAAGSFARMRVTGASADHLIAAA
jgi:tRNA A37 methylthiotransferase MiaB